MSCYERMIVLRLPASAAGIMDEDSWEEWANAHLTWDRHSFSPDLTGGRQGHFIDYILDDIEPYRGHGEDNYSRKLTAGEAARFLLVFRKEFPEFTMEDMEQVHYCDFSWYNGVEAPFIY